MKKLLINMLLILVGNLLVAFSVVGFIIPNDILSGGVAGIAVGLQPIFPWLDKAIFISFANVVLFLLGAVFLGKEFARGTVLSTIFYTIELNLLNVVLADVTFTSNEILASIYTGIFVGTGIGLVVRANSSTGGVDIIALLMDKWFHFPVHIGILIIDASIIILGISTHSIEKAMVGLISVYATSLFIDKVVSIGGQKTKSVMIISDKYQEIMKMIMEDLDRGTTILHGQGGYSGQNREVVMCVVENKQYPLLNQKIREIDERAFMVVQDAHEVIGTGFTYSKRVKNLIDSTK